MDNRKCYTYKGCQVVPLRLSESILVACGSVNRYCRNVWHIIFPDKTWCRVGQKSDVESYVTNCGRSHGAL